MDDLIVNLAKLDFEVRYLHFNRYSFKSILQIMTKIVVGKSRINVNSKDTRHQEPIPALLTLSRLCILFGIFIIDFNYIFAHWFAIPVTKIVFEVFISYI